MESDETRARFAREVKLATRRTGIMAGATATVAYPAWGLFDYLVEPANASDFIWLRVGFAIPIALFLLGLVYTRLGRERPEVFMLGIIWMVDMGIALMIANVDSHYAAYALGNSLTIYAGAFVLIWAPRYMAAVIALNIGTLAAVLLLSDPIGSDAIATVGFYVATASLLSYLAQHHRHATAWREFKALAALEREQEHNRELVAELDRQSREDSLTGVANRRAWDDVLGRQCARSARDNSPFSVLLCDLDHFKAINDQFGHAVGDVVLKTLGQALQQNARGGDLVARLGGDEFAILTPGVGEAGARDFAERLRGLVRDKIRTIAPVGSATVSFGVAGWEGADDSVETIMLRADRRLYEAKAVRDVVCAGDPESEPVEAGTDSAAAGTSRRFRVEADAGLG